MMCDFQAPAFHSADLRMVGDLLSDPVTRAIRQGALGFQKPAWPEGHSALVFVGEKLSGALTAAIRNDVLSFPAPPDWSPESSDIMRHVFGVVREHHLFCAEPISWTKFTEPQFTKGFAHFLCVPEQAMRIGRIRALLKALEVETEMEIDLGKKMTNVCVTAEKAITDGNRIDLLIVWEHSSNRFAVVIEAKLGHHITRGQLPAYRDHLEKEMKIQEGTSVALRRFTTGCR